jgi:hypothetical protein
MFKVSLTLNSSTQCGFLAALMGASELKLPM